MAKKIKDEATLVCCVSVPFSRRPRGIWRELRDAIKAGGKFKVAKNLFYNRGFFVDILGKDTRTRRTLVSLQAMQANSNLYMFVCHPYSEGLHKALEAFFTERGLKLEILGQDDRKGQPATGKGDTLILSCEGLRSGPFSPNDLRLAAVREGNSRCHGKEMCYRTEVFADVSWNEAKTKRKLLMILVRRKETNLYFFVCHPGSEELYKVFEDYSAENGGNLRRLRG